MTDTEYLRRYLELHVTRIEHPEIQALVRQVLEALPPKTWERESSLKYHPVDERGIGGNLLHTLKVAVLVEALLNASIMRPKVKDMVRAAAILHDCCRHGLDASGTYSAKNHPHLVRQLIEEKGIESSWTGPICDLIETHMGKWGNPPYGLRTSIEDLLHIADLLATQTFVQVTI